MRRCGVVMNPLFIEHDPGPYHPESPDRLRAIYARVRETGLEERLVKVESRAATQEEITRVHSLRYYERVAETDGREVALDPDTQTSPSSFQAALHAAGGGLALLERVFRGELDCGFALVRPPGHHAERERAMGFCLFNNIAVAAEHARVKLGAERVFIFDWDLHHGNGTMHSFLDRPDVFYASTHQYPYYPGTGALEDIGTGKGAGFTLSIPLSTGMGDHEYGAIVRDVLRPVAAAYKPDLILVSAGFDTLQGDPLGGMQMTPQGYGALIGELLDMAAATAKGRLVAFLEGGYHVQRQAEAVLQVLRVMLGESPAPIPAGPGRAGAIIAATQKVMARFWKF